MSRRRRGKPEERTEPPGGRDTEEAQIVVLFADVVGCSEISNHMGLAAYNTFLEDFHEVFDAVATDHLETWYEPHERPYFIFDTRGDEGCLKICIPGDEDLPDHVDVAVNLALDLKRRWLLSSDNRRRIESGLLPSDLAIGIHLGKAYMNEDEGEDGQAKHRPEGYAINLAKRIESHSRDGRYTHIYLSEAARNALYFVTEEMTYTLAGPHAISPKGVSRKICAFEVKHHYLPTDWAIVAEDYPMTKAKLYDPTDAEVELAETAHGLNPTNLWLAEEFIFLTLLRQYATLEGQGAEEDKDAVREAFAPALRVAERLATGDQRDAGILCICGLIHGESGDYSEEQAAYRSAISLDEQFGDAHQYLAYSISCQLRDRLEDEGRADVGYEDLKPDEQEMVGAVLQHCEQAKRLNQYQSWVYFDEASELSRWARLDEAVELLLRAVQMNPAVRHYIRTEPYFGPILDRPEVAKILGEI